MGNGITLLSHQNRLFIFTRLLSSSGSEIVSNTFELVSGEIYTLTLVSHDFIPYTGAYTATVFGKNISIVDPEGILGVHNDNNTTNNLAFPGKTATVHLIKVGLDIRETAQPENRICQNDTRVNANARNRILIWANSGANTVSFDLVKPPDITDPMLFIFTRLLSARLTR